MIEQDIFVGIVAVITGLFVFVSAVIDSQWVNRFWLSRRIENASNGSVSRILTLAVGILCVVLGVLLMLGFFSSDSRRSSHLISTGHDVTPGSLLPATD